MTWLVSVPLLSLLVIFAARYEIDCDASKFVFTDIVSNDDVDDFAIVISKTTGKPYRSNPQTKCEIFQAQNLDPLATYRRLLQKTEWTGMNEEPFYFVFSTRACKTPYNKNIKDSKLQCEVANRFCVSGFDGKWVSASEIKQTSYTIQC